jgi:hypothetical protein
MPGGYWVKRNFAYLPDSMPLKILDPHAGWVTLFDMTDLYADPAFGIPVGTATPQLVAVAPEHTAVINLARRPDRLTAFQQRWQAAAPDAPVHVFTAVDGHGTPGGGSAACLESHLRVMETHTGPLLIFEDDAIFADEFTLDLHAPADWDILWLGGQNRTPPEAYTQHWAIARDVVRTHAYIVRDPQRVARMMREAGYARIDPHLSYLPLRQYFLVNPTVGQAAGSSDATGEHFERDTFFTD